MISEADSSTLGPLNLTVVAVPEAVGGKGDSLRGGPQPSWPTSLRGGTDVVPFAPLHASSRYPFIRV